MKFLQYYFYTQSRLVGIVSVLDCSNSLNKSTLPENLKMLSKLEDISFLQTLSLQPTGNSRQQVLPLRNKRSLEPLKVSI